MKDKSHITNNCSSEKSVLPKTTLVLTTVKKNANHSFKNSFTVLIEASHQGKLASFHN